MVKFVQFAFIFLVSVILTSAGQESEIEIDPDSPQVEVQSLIYNEEEANFTAIETKYFNHNRRNVIATPGMYLEITCTAKYPISWQTDGYVGTVPIKVLEVRRETTNLTGPVKYLSKIRVALDTASTGYYTCYNIENDTVTAPLYVFVKNDTQPLINSGQEIVVRGNVIPCRTTNPEILVSLLRPMNEEDNKYERVTAGYDPKVGFDLGESYIFGHYLCITPYDKIRVEVVREQKVSFSVFPEENHILLLGNDLLNLTCTSVDDDIDLEYVGNKTEGVKLEANAHSKTFLYRGAAGESGSVTCFNSNVNHTWNFRFIETPRLEFDHKTGAALCYTDVPSRSIYNLGCSNPIECGILKKCLERNDIRGNCEATVYTGKTCRPDRCARLENTHFSGIIQCRVDALRISREYFTGLDNIRYFDVNAAPRDSIIHISSVNQTLTENEPAYFFCQASSFIFTEQLKFGVKYTNGSASILSEDLIKDDTSSRSSCHKRGSISRGVYLNLTEEVEKVLCLAPLSNSSEWYTVSTPVTVKHAVIPLIEGDTSATFFIGETGRNLFCYGAGHPPPMLRWVKDGEELAAEYILNETKDGSLILQFPEITEELQGDYTCLASNTLGKDKLIVSVEVVDRNQTCTSLSFSE